MRDLRPEVQEALEGITTYSDSDFYFDAVDIQKIIRDELHRLTAELEKVNAERDGLLIPRGWKVVPQEATLEMIQAVFPRHHKTSLGKRFAAQYKKAVEKAPNPHKI